MKSVKGLANPVVLGGSIDIKFCSSPYFTFCTETSYSKHSALGANISSAVYYCKNGEYAVTSYVTI